MMNVLKDSIWMRWISVRLYLHSVRPTTTQMVIAWAVMRDMLSLRMLALLSWSLCLILYVLNLSLINVCCVQVDVTLIRIMNAPEVTQIASIIRNKCVLSVMPVTTFRIIHVWERMYLIHIATNSSTMSVRGALMTITSMISTGVRKFPKIVRISMWRREDARGATMDIH